MATKTVTDDSGNKYVVEEDDLMEGEIRFTDANGGTKTIPLDAEFTISTDTKYGGADGKLTVKSSELPPTCRDNKWDFDEMEVVEVE